MDLRRWQRAWKRHVWAPVLRQVHPEIDVALGNQRVRVDLRDRIIGTLLYVQGSYEAELLRLIGTMDLKGSICVDIGANLGLHSLAMSAAVGPSGTVFAFEPEAHNFHLLEHNLQINGVSNVIPRRMAAGDTEGFCRLTLNPWNYGDHRVGTTSLGGQFFQEVAQTTIDACLQNVPQGTVGLIKIDVQGYECQVLKGMRATLDRNPQTVLILEVFPDALRATGHSALQLMQMARDLGLSGWEFQDHRLLPISDPWVYDLIRDGRQVDVILCRDQRRLWTVLENYLHEVSSDGIAEVRPPRARCA
jgi:FkbM family methyltransferase